MHEAVSIDPSRPGEASRLLSFPGREAGQAATEAAAWTKSRNPFEATVGLAAANAALNARDNRLMMQAGRGHRRSESCRLEGSDR